MEEKKTKEQLLKELMQRQRTIEQKVEEQDGLIKRFQHLVQNEGLFSQVIYNFPYPIAIFERSGVLIMANQVMLQKACIRSDELEGKAINFLSRTINENADVLKAVEDTFLGETTLLKNLIEPLSMFTREDSPLDNSAGYHSAVFFPVFKSDGDIAHGTIMLMK